MKNLNLKDIIKIIDGTLASGNLDLDIKDAAYGLWAIEKDNTMFIHLDKKVNMNLESLKKHKNICVVTESPEEFLALLGNISIVKVDNIKDAYWKIVDYYRSFFNIPVIGITGTCGKSTTTEMIKHILSKKYNISGTRKGNNAIAFDFSYLMGIDETTEAAVFEMGVDYPGNLSYSCRHFKPQIRILLNIGVYHILGCKTLEGYINAKAELLENLDPNRGVLILNSDDENIKKIDVSKFQKIIYFGISEKADFKASDINTLENAINFTMNNEGIEYKVHVPGLGKHNAYNAMAAIAAVSKVGVDIVEAIECLKTFKPMIRHLELRKGPKDSLILDDNWNNTPPSMASALEALKDMGKSKFKIAVFGQMFNLGTGPLADEQYRIMGTKVVAAQVDLLVIIGDKPKEIGRKAIELGMKKVIFINSGSEVFSTLMPYLSNDVVVLIKACEDKVNI